MDITDVRQAVSKISLVVFDDETAHILEDRLWESVLVNIANGTIEDSAVDLCIAALETRKLDFSRWCA